MKKLLTLNDARKYKQISRSIKEEIFDQYVLDAQILDIAPLLGEELFFELTNNPENHLDLLDGGNYEVAGKTYFNVGLKCVLTHYFYARYMMFGSVVDSPFSTVEKINPGNSIIVSDSSKRNLFKINQDIAANYFGNLRLYLVRSDYAKYFKSKDCIGKPKRSFRINKIW